MQKSNLFVLTMHLINPISADMLAIYKLRVSRVSSLNKVEFYSYDCLRWTIYRWTNSPACGVTLNETIDHSYPSGGIGDQLPLVVTNSGASRWILTKDRWTDGSCSW